MKIEKNIDKCGTKGLSGFSERGNPFEYKQQSMKTILFHVRIFFCPMFQIKRKKMEDYLFAISFFVYLCVKFNSVT